MADARILGVLGGMGPLASACFMQRLTLLTPAERDQDHIPTILWSDPRVPDRTAARVAGGEDPLPALVRGIRGLEAAGCGAIAIPCNTAHGWFDGMSAATSLPILHIVDAAGAELRRLGVADGRIGVMGTAGTLAMRLYQQRLDGLGYECLTPSDEEMQSRVTPAITAVKANKLVESYEPLAEVARSLMARGARAVVLACGASPAWPRWLPEDYHDADFFPDVRTVAARFIGRTQRESGTALLYDHDHSAFTYATAVLLARIYERVVIATPREGVAAEEPLVNRQGIHRRLAAHGIEVRNFCEPVFDDGLAEGVVTLRNVFGATATQLTGVSLITHATPRIPRDSLVAPLRAAGIDFTVVGDCQAPRSLLVATGEGYRAGMRW